MKFDIVSISRIYELMKDPTSYGKDGETWKSDEDRYNCCTFGSHHIVLPKPLSVAHLGFVSDNRGLYHARFLIAARHPKVFRGLSSKLEYGTYSDNPLIFVSTSSDGEGYVLRGPLSDEPKFPFLAVLPSTVDGLPGNGRLIFMGEGGAEPRSLGKYEQFSEEMGVFMSFVRAYVATCYRGRRVNESAALLRDVTLHFDCL